MAKHNKSPRTFACPSCGQDVTLPWAWVLGVEVVFRCKGCRRQFRTGFKTGALLFALSLSLALATANMAVWLLSSFFLPLFAACVLPLWLVYGFVLRRWWLLRRCRKICGRTPVRNPD